MTNRDKPTRQTLQTFHEGLFLCGWCHWSPENQHS